MKQHLLGIGLAMTLMAAGPTLPPSKLTLAGIEWWTPPKHLEPEGFFRPMGVPADRLPSVFISQELAERRAMQRVFEPVLDESARVFMLSQPSLSSADLFAVGLKQTAQGFKIFGARPASRSKAKSLGQCEAPIEAGLARRVIAAWDAVVMQRKRPPGYSWGGDGNAMMDGPVEHFTSRLKDGVVTGHLFMPQRPWNPGWLSLIAADLNAICRRELNQGAEPWAEMRHALGQINLKSQERVPYRPG